MSSQTIDVKQPDSFLANGRKGLQYYSSHTKSILIGIAGILVIGAGIVFVGQQSVRKEQASQEKYFVIEKKVNEVRRKFEEAEQNERMKKADPKSAKPEMAMKSGDLAKDYGTLPSDLEAFINSAPETNAGLMAALQLSSLLREYKKLDEAASVISKVNTKNSTNGFLNALVVHQKASVAVEKNDCKQAIEYWNKIVSSKDAKFLHQESKISMGLCYQKLGDMVSAEKSFSDAASGSAKELDSAAGKDAEKYLRLLRAQKTSGT